MISSPISLRVCVTALSTVGLGTIWVPTKIRGSGGTARPKGQDHRPRRADPGAFGLDGNDHLRWRPDPLRIRRGCVRGPAWLLELGETDRLQSDPRAPEGRDTDRRI